MTNPAFAISLEFTYKTTLTRVDRTRRRRSARSFLGDEIAVVLLDVNMPGFDGPQTFEGIRAFAVFRAASKK